MVYTKLMKNRAPRQARHAKTEERNRKPDITLPYVEVINHLNEAIILVDGAGRVTFINARASEELGCDGIKNLGKPYHEVLPITDRNGKVLPERRNPIHAALRNGKRTVAPHREEYFAVRPNGALHPVFLTLSPISGRGDARNLLVVFHDATRERRLDEIKSDFISIASHQLRTPLAVASLHTDMLLSGHAGEISADQRAYLKEIAFYNKKMLELLNVFLTVSKLELKSFKLNVTRTDLKEVITDILHELSVKAENKEIAVQSSYEEGATTIETDPELMRVALQNLISNAVKYTPLKGMVRIMVEKKGGEALVSISDTGYGIPRNEHTRIFTKLYRGERAQKQDSDGSGLGLYITKSLVEKCGGKIWFESEEHNGTSFYVSLPFKFIERKTKTASREG